jgi:hypothetical protein
MEDVGLGGGVDWNMGCCAEGGLTGLDSGAGEWVGRDEQNFARTFAKNFDSRKNLP